MVIALVNDVATDDEDLSSNSEDGEEGDIGENENLSSEDISDNEEDNEDDDEEEDDDDDADDDEPLGDPESEDETVGNAGWADAMAKVLAMGKNSSKPVSVLSKAKKGNSKSQKRKGSDGEESSGESDDPEPQRKLEPLAVRKARKKEIDSIGRKIPNVLERNSEKALSKIATRGVVQLFNAVRDHQKDVKTKLKDAGGSFRKQEKVYKNLDKNSFIEMLSGKPVSSEGGAGSQPAKKQKLASDNSGSTESSWNILREDYMLGAKMKDWDKESDEET